jgi:hypothetical protein
MPARVTLKAVNEELARLGYTARLAKAGGYFYFHFGEAADWLDRTVTASTISSRTIPEWIDEFHRLEKLNEQISGPAATKSPPKRGSKKSRKVPIEDERT